MKIVKVLHIISNMNRGGAETMIMNIYRNIDKDKIQFDFLCLNPGNKKNDYEEEIQLLGGKIYKIKSNKIVELYKFLSKNKYDVIHSHIMFFSGIVNCISKLVGIKKTLVHSHSSSDIKKENFSRRIYIFFSRKLINKYSDIKISCGNKAGKYLYGNKEKYIVLKNGIDLEKFVNVNNNEVEDLKEEFCIKKEDFVIGHVGNFLEVKNQEFFIEFAKEFIKHTRDFKIVLVGAGPKLEDIKKEIEKENLNKYFILTGKRNDINIFMNMFDVFVMPSLYEGFPLVVVEALAGDNICFLSKNISEETKIIEFRVHFFDLNMPRENLVQEILNKQNKKDIINIKEELIKEGFSITEMTRKITEIYLE